MKIFKYFIPNLFEGSLLLACARVPVCPWIGVVPGCLCARGSELCPGARASDVLGACCLSVTQTLYSPEAARLHQLQGAMSMDQAVAVCLLIPQTDCPH